MTVAIHQPGEAGAPTGLVCRSWQGVSRRHAQLPLHRIASFTPCVTVMYPHHHPAEFSIAPKVADLHVARDGAVRERAPVLLAQPQRARKAQQPRRHGRRRAIRRLPAPGTASFSSRLSRHISAGAATGNTCPPVATPVKSKPACSPRQHPSLTTGAVPPRAALRHPRLPPPTHQAGMLGIVTC